MSVQLLELEVRPLAGSLAVGGYSTPPVGFDRTHARGADGRPLIPATTLRGALREGLESVLRAAGRAACVRGTGRSLGEADGEGLTPSGCTLGADGQPCDACRLFGQGGFAEGTGSGRAGLVLGDALLDGEATPMAERHGVAVARASRSAREGLLFNAYLPAPRPKSGNSGLCFRAEGRLLDGDLLTLLKTAATVTTHLGGGQSRGFGRVEISVLSTVQDVPVDSDGPVNSHVPVNSDEVWFSATLERPANIGLVLTHENMRGTRHEVPGSALRGAVGFGLAEVLENPDEAPFQDLVAERGAVFDFMYRCDASTGVDGVVGPWPMTARACKKKPSHFAHDTLFEALAVALAGQEDDVASIAEAARAAVLVCPDCSAPLERRAWSRGQQRATRVRAVTRVARDRSARSAKDGMLFTTQLIEEGTRFVGSVRRLPEGDGDVTPAARLSQALALPLSVGRGRSMGWGRLRIEPIERTLRPLAERMAAFRAALNEAAVALPSLAQKGPRLVPLTLLSPLLVPGEDDGTGALAQRLGLEPVACLKVRRFGLENGWNQRGSVRGFWRSVLAGAVFVFEWTGDDDLVSVLERVEREGVGERTEQGFGRVLAFDPAFSNPRPDQVDDLRSDSVESAQIGRLVGKAESVMAEAFQHGQVGHGKLSKAQLSQLVGVTQEAQCHAEVANYLRYQGGRRGGWDLDLVHRVLRAFEEVFQPAETSDDDAMHAWQKYATYLSRSFTYQDAVAKQQRQGGGRRV